VATLLPDWLRRVDEQSFLWLHRGLDDLGFDGALRLANELGNVWIAVPILVGILALDPRVGRRLRRALTLVLALVLAWGAAHAAKDAVDRERPVAALAGAFERGEASDRLAEGRTRGSFPSGHASTAFAWGVLLFAWGGAIPGAFRRRAVRASLLALAASAALARVHAGAHFPLDVLAGALVGTGAALAALAFERLLPRSRVPRAPG
jgi:membrane-associated phospholipid phosphatase